MRISKITSKDFMVMESGSVIAYDRNAAVDILLKSDDGFKFTVRLKFVDDDSKKGNGIGTDVDADNDVITFTCYNFSNPWGTGTTMPIKVATINNKGLFLHIWVYLLGDKERAARRVDYTFYLEE